MFHFIMFFSAFRLPMLKVKESFLFNYFDLIIVISNTEISYLTKLVIVLYITRYFNCSFIRKISISYLL